MAKTKVRDLDDGRRLRVALPEGYDQSASRYPVIYVLDERWSFGTAVDTVTMMSMAREIPKCIVIGVGYQDDSLAEISERRAAEYTPTEADFPELTRVEGRYGSGGAAKTCALLIEEIVPWVDENVRSLREPDGRVLFGHSFSGLCALSCFLTRPGTFGKYLLASPSIWWDDRVLETWPLPAAVSSSDSASPEVASQLFISAGGEEVTEPATVLANARRFSARLAGGGHDVLFRAFDGESHFSTIGPAMSAGLRHLIGTEPSPV